ncbi:MAG: putative baseplate assembly protein [Chloroflexi bacterium]|nr:putative baseplate assembly protein [Chloroflexota bacterium]
MPLEAPQLDDRRFDDLVDEARRRIARYSPEWTDFNESDPGATLVDLFAWLTETMLYRLNRLPELNYIKFLKLLGMDQAAAVPACAHLTFKPQPGIEASVPRGTQVAGPPDPDGLPLIFETEEPVDLVVPELTQVQVFNGSGFQLASEANRKRDASYAPFGWQPQPGNALYLGFEPPETPTTPIFPSEIRLRIFLPEPARPGSTIRTTEVGPDAKLPAPPVTLVFEYRRQASDSFWRPLPTYRDESVGLTREGYVTFQGPAEMEPTIEGRVEEPMYWLRCRIARGAYDAGARPEVAFVVPNTVPAVNLETIRDEPVGMSDGRPGLQLDLERRPVSELSLEVRDVDGALKAWQAVDDFLAQPAEAPVFVLAATSGRIRFGDGRQGAIPVAGSDIVARSYRAGGGEAGNAGPDTIADIVTYVPGVAEVTNIRAAAGGRNEQTLDDLKRYAPQALRNKGRAITSEDFSALAERVAGVFRAVAVPLMHPAHPGVKVPGAVTVIIVPITDGPRPEPTSDLIERVAAALESCRPLTAEVYVRGPSYTPVRVVARVSAKRYAALDDARRNVVKAIAARLDPRRRALGEDLHPSELYDAILDVDEVSAVESMRVFDGDRELEGLDDRVVVAPDELVFDSGEHEIAVVRAEDR